MKEKLLNYISLFRVHQYLKNVFILLPPFFGGRMAEPDILIRTALAFLAFSLAASSVYVLNDWHDAEEDRQHPRKKNRPIASGKVGGKEAALLALPLLASSLALSFMLGPEVFWLVVFYLLLNTAYTVSIKHVAIVDVTCVAVFYVIRLFVGSAVTDVELSIWIIIMTFLLALFVSLAKRRDDLLIYIESGEKTRQVLDGYSLEVLNSSMIMMAAVVIVSYIMYTVSPEVIDRVNTDKMYVTVVFVILGIMRYMQISFVEKSAGSPTEVLLKDRFLQISILGWLVTFGIILYR
jgi:4-hydroxybenzoate polyprenyltransferase